jgi:hypothetical protein
MLHFYVLYACVHITAGKPAPLAGRTECVERQVFFRAEQCVTAIPKRGRLIERSKRARSWVECKEARADSWIPAEANVSGSRLYQAQAGISDEQALAALLTPLSPQARAMLESRGLKRPFQRAFQAPGGWSYFIVGTGSSVIVFVVTHLDDFQFAQMAADVSSSSATLTTEGLDFSSLAEDAGVELSYHMEMSRRTMPPPGGLETLRPASARRDRRR